MKPSILTTMLLSPFAAHPAADASKTEPTLVKLTGLTPLDQSK